MMRKFYYDFQIDKKPILAPDKDLKLEFNDLDSDDTGRDESGIMHRIVLREGVKTWSPYYAALTYEELQYMESLFKGKSEFRVDYRDLDGQPATCTAYRSKFSLLVHNARTGTYRNYGFNIIEC